MRAALIYCKNAWHAHASLTGGAAWPALAGWFVKGLFWGLRSIQDIHGERILGGDDPGTVILKSAVHGGGMTIATLKVSGIPIST